MSPGRTVRVFSQTLAHFDDEGSSTVTYWAYTRLDEKPLLTGRIPVLEYQTDYSAAAERLIMLEAMEVWGAFRNEVDLTGISGALLIVHEAPRFEMTCGFDSGHFPFLGCDQDNVAEEWTYVFVRDQGGKWKDRPDNDQIGEQASAATPTTAEVLAKP